ARLRDELLNGEVFYTLAEAKVVIEGWRRHYNAIRPHSALGYSAPAPQTLLWRLSRLSRHRRPLQLSHRRRS
ncbi:MAG: transposase, partial [Rubritepida sp.]|nr:transposase [Rubritepida sp.]